MLIALMTVLLVRHAHAEDSFICARDVRYGSELSRFDSEAHFQNAAYEMNSDEQLQFDPVALQCKQIEKIHSGLYLISLGLTDAAAVLACTGVGTTASAYIGLGAAATMTIDYLIGFLPCQSETDGSPEQIKTLVKQD